MVHDLKFKFLDLTNIYFLFLSHKGGLGACVSKVDVLASTPEELMYLQGTRTTMIQFERLGLLTHFIRRANHYLKTHRERYLYGVL